MEEISNYKKVVHCEKTGETIFSSTSLFSANMLFRYRL
jgi:hypothetical protein